MPELSGRNPFKRNNFSIGREGSTHVDQKWEEEYKGFHAVSKCRLCYFALSFSVVWFSFRLSILGLYYKEGKVALADNGMGLRKLTMVYVDKGIIWLICK